MDQVSVGLRAPEQQFRQVQVSSPVVSLQELQPLPASTPITVVLKTRPGSVGQGPAPGADPLVSMLVSDDSFVSAVQSQQIYSAAAVAVNVLKANGIIHSESSPSNFMFPGTDGDYQRKEFKLGEKVVVNRGNKRNRDQSSSMGGREAVVVGTPGSGWVQVRMADGGEVLKLQQRYVSHSDGFVGSPSFWDGSSRDCFGDTLDDGAYSMPIDSRSGTPGAGGGGYNGTPASVRSGPLQHSASMFAGLPNLGGLPAGLQRGGSLSRPRDTIRQIRSDMLHVEEVVPWNAVRKAWKTKRTVWRRAVARAESVAELADRLKELRSALLTETSHHLLMDGEQQWSQQVETCLQPSGSHTLLASLWEQFKASLPRWLELRTKIGPLTTVQLQAGALRTLQALHDASKRGHDLKSAKEMMDQVPINSIVNDNEELRAMVYHLLDRESRANASGNWLPLQNLIGNGYAEFDSDAESSADEGSVTDMSDNEF